MTDQDRPGPREDPTSESVFPPIGTIIIRAWFEPSHQRGFRARISYGEAPSYDQGTVATADPAEVLEIVQNWLNSLHGLLGGK